MKKVILFLSVMFLLFTSINTFASVASDYTFTQFIGTYNSISGDTIAKSTSTTIDPFQLNDVTYGPFALPFTFIFDCRDYTNFFINSNGFITFGATAPGISNYAPIASSEAFMGSISAFGLDLIGVFGTSVNTNGTNVLTNVANFQGVVVGRNITGVSIPANTIITAFDPVAGTITISAVTTGAPVIGLVVQIAAGSIVRTTTGFVGHRVHTIQWTNFRQYIIEGTDDNFNFQIKLFEDSAKLQIIYGNMDKNTVPVPVAVGQVGLRGVTNTDFNNRTNDGTLNWATSTAGGVNAVTSTLSSTLSPVSGQTYSWIPNSNCILPVEMSSFTSSINGRDVTLNWTTTSEKNNSSFDIERSSAIEHWSKVGSVQGNGTTLSSMNYFFTDRGLSTGSYKYRLKQIDFNGNFKYYNLNNEVKVGIPTKFDLSQNYPNPFNPSTKINYDLPFDGKVSLKIFDLSGKEVMTLVNTVQIAGYYTTSFNGNNISSGIYFYTLTSNNFTSTKKMLLVK